MDKGHKYTDKQIELLEKRLKRFYKEVSAEARKKLTEYFERNEERYMELWRRFDEGEITAGQFEYLILSDDELETLQGELVNEYVDGDEKAMSMIGAVLATIYAYNHNAQASKMQSETGIRLPRAVKDNIGVQIGKLMRRRRMLPPPNPDKMKDRIWHRAKIRLVVNDGLRHGRSIYDIAENLERVTNMDIGAAIRAARTACTNAENQAKLDAMYVLRDEYGVDVKKQWYATLDNRTRTHHRVLHGEIRELEEPFSNGLQYPADPQGDPSEVWNCRCTLIDVMRGMDDIKHSPNGMSRKEWINKKPKTKPYPIPKNKR